MSKQVVFGRGETVNRTSFCARVGWSRATFDAWVKEGLPVERVPANKGDEYRIHSGDALAWLFDHGARRARQGPADREPPPPGAEMLAGVDDPVAAGFGVAALTIVYELPRLTAVAAVEVGVPIGRAFELSAFMTGLVLHFVHGRAAEAGLEPWASGEEEVLLETRSFTPVNWPNLARKAGEPAWEPPRAMPGWPELSVEERAACVRHGEEEDARHAAELAAEEGAGAAAAAPVPV